MLFSQAVGQSDVTCCLALVVEGADRLEVMFPRLLPRLPLLEHVYRDLQRQLQSGHGRDISTG